MNLSVEVKNVSDDKEDNIGIEIIEASLLSRQWKLRDLTTARNKDNILISHERAHYIFKATRLQDTVPEGRVECSRLKVAKDQPDSTNEVNTPSFSKFLVEYKTHFLDGTEPVPDNDNRKGLIQSMFVLRWKAHDRIKGKTVIGQHCLWLNCFTKAESREKEPIIVDTPSLQLDDLENKLDTNEAKKNNNNVVVFRFEHTNHINHNFKQMKLCLVPITINLVNCYGVPVRVFIDMSKQQNR